MTLALMCSVLIISFRRNSKQIPFPVNFNNFVDDLVKEVFDTGGATNLVRHEAHWKMVKNSLTNFKKRAREKKRSASAPPKNSAPKKTRNKRRKTGTNAVPEEDAANAAMADGRGGETSCTYAVVVENPPPEISEVVQVGML